MAVENDVFLIGHIVHDARVEYPIEGPPTCEFLIVNTYQRGKRGGFREWPNYFDCIIYGKTARQLCGQLKKGVTVTVRGELRHFQYQNVSGNRHHAVKVIVRVFEFGWKPRRDDASISEVPSDAIIIPAY